MKIYVRIKKVHAIYQECMNVGDIGVLNRSPVKEIIKPMQQLVRTPKGSKVITVDRKVTVKEPDILTINGYDIPANELCKAFSNHCSYTDIFEKYENIDNGEGLRSRR